MVPALSPTRGVILDFYGTLGESSWTGNWFEDTLATHGYRVDRESDRTFASDAWDGEEHDEHSQSRDHYNAWLRSRWVELLAVAGVPEAEREPTFSPPSTPAVRNGRCSCTPIRSRRSRALRGRGLRLVLCSNWDWDLDAHVAKLGLGALVDQRRVLGVGRRPQASRPHLPSGARSCRPPTG